MDFNLHIKEWRKEKARRRARAWYAANKERAHANSARWSKENPERRARILDKHHTEKAVVRAKRAKEWAADNPDTVRESSRRYRENHPERSRENKRRWRKKNPDKVNEMTHRRRARKKGAGGTYTIGDIRRICKMQGDRCAYCRVQLRGKYEIDHIIPILAGGSNDAKNIQLLCRKLVAGCNQSKGARDPVEFAQSLGLLL